MPSIGSKALKELFKVSWLDASLRQRDACSDAQAKTLFVFYYGTARKQVRPKEGQVAGKKLLMNGSLWVSQFCLAIEKGAMKCPQPIENIGCGGGF
jgi:hypothetical protein